MKREEKSLAIADLSDRLKEADAVFAVDYRGISVTQAAELRRSLAEADAVFKVVKNRLAKLSAADAGTEGLDDLLVGPTALTLIKGDAVIAAKAISTFSRTNDVLEFKGGLMDGEALSPESFQAIAKLPGVDVLRGQLTGLAASPLTGLVAGMSNLISGLGRQLAQIAEQGLVSGEAPAAEAPAEEDAPAEEAPAEQASEPAPDSEQPDADPADPGSGAEESAGSAEVSEEESQPEEPAADAEAEGSEE